MKDNFDYSSRAKDTVLHFLQTTFSNPDLFPDQINPFLYSDDDKNTKIMINDFNSENLNAVNVKPALLVQRGSMSPVRISLGDRTRDTFLAGYEQRELLMNVNLVIHCISREGLEAESLAVVVFKLIRYLNEDICKNYKVFNIDALNIGSETPVSNEIKSVPVSIIVSIPDLVQINFKSIQISTLTMSKQTISHLNTVTLLHSTVGMSVESIIEPMVEWKAETE